MGPATFLSSTSLSLERTGPGFGLLIGQMEMVFYLLLTMLGGSNDATMEYN